MTSTMFSRVRPLVPLVIIAAAAAFAAGCKDSLGTGALVRTHTDTMVAYAITGTPITAPVALNLSGFSTDSINQIYADPSVERVDESFDFDLAFDIDSAGSTVLVTPSRLASRLAVRLVSNGVSLSRIGPHQVGIRTYPAGTSYESIVEAPTGGFVFDSLARVANGSVVTLQSYSSACADNLRPYLYAKLIVDSTKAAERKVYFRVTLNRDCGYRSFRPGIPRD